ncbi:MAG TPA: hypothetical protein VNN62_09510 [Methylomirabilota bacterium]|jgi:biopolymer transport protein ExbD|nr:hypothetical protein [Methylomirabilota bacterium]
MFRDPFIQKAWEVRHQAAQNRQEKELPRRAEAPAADRNLSYGQVVDVMDDCKAAGVVTIGVITKREPSGRK